MFIVYLILFVALVGFSVAARKSGPERAVMVRPAHAAAVALLLVFWLGPACYTGLTRNAASGLPHALTDLHRVSCLFTRSLRTWSVYYVQVQSKESGEWVTVSEDPFFQMNVFGYRTRFHRLMSRSSRGGGYRRRQELAAWIRDRYSSMHPEKPPPMAVRFVRGWFRVGEEPPPSGRWVTPKLADLPESRTSIISTHDFRPRSGQGEVRR